MRCLPFAVAPIRSDDGQIMALLGLRIEPHQDFTRILATARAGKTGETYAFGRDGKQLSESRFDNDLKRVGLIPDTVDARSDLYSLGALGYFLVTGEALFDCLTLGEVLMHQVKDLPARPSKRVGKPVAPDLEDVLMRCLAKDPASRPANARELDDALARCRNAVDWTREQADEWWRKFAATQSEKTMVTAPPGAK